MPRYAIITSRDPGIGTNVTQTITGVQDSAGQFIGKLFFPQCCFALSDVMTAGAIPIGGYSDFHGIDTGAIRSLYAPSGAFSGFGFKANDGGVSFGDHSVMDVWSDNFGQSEIYGVAKISAIRLGEFDILATNLRTGYDIQWLVLGGDDFDFTFTNNITGTYTTPSKPQGFLAFPVPTPQASGLTTWGTGGQNVVWGFATRDGDYGAANLNVVNQGNNWSTQLTNTFQVDIDQVTGVRSTNNPTVSAWNALSFAISNPGGVSGTGLPLVFCGENLRCTGGAITAGDASFDARIYPRIIFFTSIGYPAGATVHSPSGQMCRGWAGATSQSGFWSGERTNGNTPPLYGARYLSSTKPINLTSNINGASTVLDTVGRVDLIHTNGIVDMDWTSLSGNDEQIIWFAIGTERLPDSANIGKGIYKLVPDKRQDTVWFDFLTEDEVLRKIPNPNAWSSLIGDSNG